MARRLIIDESIYPRIAVELRGRGCRDAETVGRLYHTGIKDPDLLRSLARDYPECVLVTSDDSLPQEHASMLRQTKITVATISRARAPSYEQDEWERDIIHRWAYRMEMQTKGTIRRYSLSGGRDWSPRKRPIRHARS